MRTILYPDTTRNGHSNLQTAEPPSCATMDAYVNAPNAPPDAPRTPFRLNELYDLLAQETGFECSRLFRNASVAMLYEDALRYEEGTVITADGALATFSGAKTGRSPKDKRIVEEPTTAKDIWWGPINIAMDEHTFQINRERAIDYLKTRRRIYVFDGFAGWDPKYRIKVRVICARAYHGTLSCMIAKCSLVHAQHADSADKGGAGALWQARLYAVQCGRVPSQPLYDGDGQRDER